MKQLSKRATMIVSSSLAISILAAACTISFKPAEITVNIQPTTVAEMATPAAEAMPAEAPVMHQEMVMSAAMLRATLDTLFGEHVLLAADATDAALHGREAEFTAAAEALDHNSQDIAAAIELVYGKDASDAFLPLWRKHISFFVNYTIAVSAKDEAGRQKALDDLTGYAEDFGAFLASANPNLTVEAVKGLLGPHVGTLTAVIDAQAIDDYPTAFMHQREAYMHMDMIAKALAGAIGQQFPDGFTGAADSMGANLRSTLNLLLAEHVSLAATTTSAAINGRSDEMTAAADALDNNSVDLSLSIGAVYGKDAGDAFLPLWRKHIGFFVDYTTAVATKDEAARTKAVDDLTGYAEDFGAFLASANPNLTVEAVKELLGPHVGTLTAVIDAQGADNHEMIYTHLREAYAHMSMIANPLSDAIIAQFPDIFGDEEAMMGEMDHSMEMTGTEEMTGTMEMTDTEEMSGTMEMEEAQSVAVMSAGQLRSTLDGLFGEHVLLAANATDAALHGRQDEFAAAAAALDHNSEDIAGAITLVYGAEAGDAFLPLWRKHIGFFVDYTNAVATKDEAARSKAMDDLTAYAEDFGAFLASANPNLTVEAVKSLLGPHVGTLTAVIDAQAIDDYPAAFMHLREAYMHMDMIAAGLAGAIGQQFPETFPGMADSPAAGLRSALNQLLAEHVALAANATNAALGGRNDEFAAAADALDANSVDLSKAIASVYGAEAGDAFLPLWRKHIGFFVDYTNAVATKDEAARSKAIDDLTGYAEDFGAFLASANPNLTVEAVKGLLGPHVGTLTAVIDAQGAGDPEMAYMHLREAYAHMSMIANPLSDAIIAQFPDIFGTEDAAMMQDMGQMDEMSDMGEMHEDVVMSAAMLRSTLDLLLGEHVALAASATDAALRGRGDEFAAAANALDGKSVDIAGAIGLVYGTDAGDAFLPLWRKHIGFFVDYTNAVAQGDEAARQKALNDLDAYAEDFGAFIESANPNLPKAAVAELLRQHVATLTTVIDAQGVKTAQESGDQMNAYPTLRTAFAHMDMEASALAGGIATQFPDRFPGMVDTPAAGLRSALTQLLSEHALLLIKTIDAATHSRTIEYEAAFAALDANSVDLSKAVGSVYGDDAGTAFLGLWRKHIGFFVDYALALIDNNDVAKEKAANELTGYAQDFAAFLNSANPDLPADVVAGLVTEHAKTTLAAIDATVMDDPAAYYAALRTAYSHMSMIANGLSDTIIAQFPDIFGVEEPVAMAGHDMAGMTASEEMTDTMEMTGTMEMSGTMEMTDTMAMTDTMTDTMSEEMTVEVAISTFNFKPGRIEVPVGTTVVWTNNDAINHTVTSGEPGAPDGIFDSGNFNQGEQFSVTFTEAGEYPYFCNRHNGMRGVIVVTQ